MKSLLRIQLTISQRWTHAIPTGRAFARRERRRRDCHEKNTGMWRHLLHNNELSVWIADRRGDHRSNNLSPILFNRVWGEINGQSPLFIRGKSVFFILFRVATPIASSPSLRAKDQAPSIATPKLLRLSPHFNRAG